MTAEAAKMADRQSTLIAFAAGAIVATRMCESTIAKQWVAPLHDFCVRVWHCPRPMDVQIQDVCNC